MGVSRIACSKSGKKGIFRMGLRKAGGCRGTGVIEDLEMEGNIVRRVAMCVSKGQ